MTHRKTGRKLYKCGECKYYKKESSICKHREMNEKKVDSASFSECGSMYFCPTDDYESN